MKHFLLASLMLGFASMGYANTVNNTNTFVKKHTRVLSEDERFTVNNFTFTVQNAENRSVSLTKYTGTTDKEVTVPAEISYNNDTYNIKEIAFGAFKGASTIEKVTLADGIEVIAWSAFTECKKLKNITLPSSLIHIAENAFSDCAALNEIIIPANVSLGSNVFNNCSSLTKVVIGEGLEILPEGTFSNCTSLSSVSLPNSLTEISMSAFSYCSSLKTLEIPKNVDAIDEYAFEETMLENIYLHTNALQISTLPAAWASSTNATIYVPQGMQPQFEEAKESWKRFTIKEWDEKNTTTSIQRTNLSLAKDIKRIYTLQGTVIQQLQKGFNILLFQDGKTQKVWVK